MKPLSARQRQVLQATVHHYVDTIEPVGSRTLVQRFGIPVSSATVRSAMGALEQRGLLMQPHTSAGRVPSQLGYRHYVDCLLPEPGHSVQLLERELTGLTLRWAALDDLLAQLARRLTDFTGLMALISRPAQQHPARLEAIRLVGSGDRLLVMLVEDSGRASHLNLRLPFGAEPELNAIERWTDRQLAGGAINWDSLPPQLQNTGGVLRHALELNAQTEEQPVVVHGLSRLIAEPEFQSSSDVRPLVELIDEQPRAVVRTISQSGVWIGEEHPHRALQNCAVVQAPYRCGSDGVGQVALLGPMRMAYSTAKAAVQRVARHLELVLS